MPTLIVPKTYANNEVLREQDLDNVRNALLTFFNTTKLDSNNLQIDSIISSLSAAQVGNILTKANASAVESLLDKVSQSSAEAFYAKADIYNVNSSQDDNQSLTTSFATSITYSFTETGTYLVGYGGTNEGASNLITELKLVNNSVDVNPALTIAGLNTASFIKTISGTSGTDLLLQIRRIGGSAGFVDTFLSVVRIA